MGKKVKCKMQHFSNEGCALTAYEVAMAITQKFLKSYYTVLNIMNCYDTNYMQLQAYPPTTDVNSFPLAILLS